MATAFLVIHFVFVDRIWVVFFSGIADFAMGLAILWAWSACKRIAPDARVRQADA